MIQAQVRNHTALNRIRNELRTVRAVTSYKSPKILSFGCSIGDEVATIRSEFPNAEIFACDINMDVLETAKRSVGHLATVFYSDADNLAKHGPFDIIIASAVLCLNPPKDIETHFPFETFNSLIEGLDRSLNQGGVLVILNASYRFLDTVVSASYDVIRSDLLTSSGFVDVFAPDGRVFLKMRKFMQVSCFRRGRAFSAAHDEELADCIFRKSTAERRTIENVQLSPVPDTFVEEFRYERSDTDVMYDTVDEALIIVTRSYRFGVDTATGQRGYTSQFSWPSVVNDGETHVRPEVWHET